ncbi:BMA_0021/BMA_0022 family TOMM bacteriocin [Derxia gummosa]|uniref:BMA_0021/BMA_0022 family TOMM bacteriocin n=1 Tax=Derxia gummosa DSM 723 TaxID=1121388 RepID=A0A8B6X369_9BURK|nr:BMA_0021/BMA_0022 family TOMM bacteriocin [Derxia gummosa]
MSNKAQHGTYDKFLEYRAVIMQAIAKAWSNESFYRELVADPRAALLEHFGYEVPFKIAIEIDTESDEWLPTTVADWKVLKNNRLRMVLPPAPPVEERIEALADYNRYHLTFLG